MTEPSPQPNLHAPADGPGYSIQFWILVLLIGVFAGLAGAGLMRLLFAVEHVAWSYHSGNFYQAVCNASNFCRVRNMLLAGVVVAAGRKLLPKGGDVDAAIWFRSGRVPLLSTIAQAITALISVGLGTSLGRESPIKQAGGAIASALARLARVSPAEQQLLVACGVGAGMASAYNVPLGGAVFAIEVLIGTISLRLVLPALVASVAATGASWAFLPIGPVYQVPEYSLSLSLVIWSIIAGPLLGLAAVALVKAIAWAEAHRPSGVAAAVMPIVTLTLLGCLSIAYPELLGNGKDTVQLALTDKVSLSLLLALPALKLLATAGCLGSGASGGLFTPTMAVGALLGGSFGHAWSAFWPGSSPGSFAVVGSAAVLAAATLGPISALVLILELTRHVDATMVPMLFAVGGATLIARRFESRSIYSARVKRPAAK